MRIGHRTIEPRVVIQRPYEAGYLLFVDVLYQAKKHKIAMTLLIVFLFWDVALIANHLSEFPDFYDGVLSVFRHTGAK